MKTIPDWGKSLFMAAAMMLALVSSAAEPAFRAEPGAVKQWQDLRFGLFIHWGPVSLEGTEISWSRAGERRGYRSKGTEVPVEVYDNLFKKFNPTNFNARQWVDIAQAGGMRYLVFTSRHHDGFSMFDTHADEYKITSPLSPFRRDVVKELAAACQEAHLRFGVYYSQPNWHSPDAFTPGGHTNYQAYLKQQVRELLAGYGPLEVLWFDGLGKSAADYDTPALDQMARELQPHILINNRGGLPEDFDTPEQRIGRYQDQRPWESCITLCRQWSWKPGDQMKSLKECVQTLVLCAGGDGNLLLNVGPMPDGRIEPRQAERLKEIGAWLAKNGESIYGTRGGPWKPSKKLASTRKGNNIFVHLFHRDGEAIVLPDIPRKVTAALVLGGGAAGARQDGGTLFLTVPASATEEPVTVVKLQLDGSAKELKSPEAELVATASNTYRRLTSEYGPEMAVDGDPETRWATDAGTRQAWLELNLAHARKVSGMTIDEWFAGSPRIQSFQLQYWDGAWKPLYEGTTIGPNKGFRFSPVTAQRFRLSILEATDGPSIKEIRFDP